MAPIIYNKLLDIQLPLKSATLFGNLYVPHDATGIILFVHGSGSSRFSKRNNQVAEHLNHSRFATLLFDLLTTEEEQLDNITRELRFNIPLLAKRLIEVTDWVLTQSELQNLKIGYFGSSTGAAAALIAATHHVDVIDAIVSRGGRPDLANQALPNVEAPTLFIVGGLDDVVIALNHDAKNKMSDTTIKKLTIVDGATHLFEEPGKLDEVVTLATDWFLQHLKSNTQKI